MSRKRSKKATEILTATEVDMVAKRVREALGPTFDSVAEEYGIDVESEIRFMAVSTRCQKAREDLGLAVREAAKKSGLRQYRIRAIEGGQFRNMRRQDLDRYIEFLNLGAWFAQWNEANHDVIAGLTP